MHPAGDRFVEPGMASEGDREKLESALVFAIEEDAPGAGEVGWKVVGELGVGGRTGSGFGSALAIGDRGRG